MAAKTVLDCIDWPHMYVSHISGVGQKGVHTRNDNDNE